jgi:hypothetical protein
MVVQPITTRPDPDPTLLTTENLRREIANLKDLLEANLIASHELTVSEIRVLSSVTEERFSGIAIQFAERDKRTEQLSLADKTAIAAALQAQKEAAGATNESNSVALAKMENNFTKLIDQGSVLLASVVKNTDDKINDLKSRIDTGDGKSRGMGDVIGWIVGAAGLVFALAALLTRH